MRLDWQVLLAVPRFFYLLRAAQLLGLQLRILLRRRVLPFDTAKRPAALASVVSVALASATTAAAAAGGPARLPTDLLQRAGKCGGKPTVVISAAKLGTEAFADPDALVDWWVACQARAQRSPLSHTCAHSVTIRGDARSL